VTDSNRDAIEAMIFKPATGGGFLFQAPKPWLFGQARNYLVSEAQKDEILAVMAPSAPAWRRYAVVAALILGPVIWALAIVTLLWAISDHDEPTFGEVIAMMVLILVPILGALFLTVAWSAQVKLARLAPLIGALQPTDERITRADVRRGMVRSMSSGAILAVMALCGASALMTAFALGMRVGRQTLFTGSTVVIAFNLIIMLVVVATFFTLALSKARQGGETDSR
jgi:hypothetical protein